MIVEPTPHSPEIRFEPSSGRFLISGVSRPEDVRTFYYPVVDWLRKFLDEEIKTGKITFDESNPLILDVTLKYFNSSSAKFLFDIFSELGNINEEGGKLKIRWFYESGDDDMLEAGEELSEIAEIPFEFIET